MLDEGFRALGELVREHAAARPAQPALVQGDDDARLRRARRADGPRRRRAAARRRAAGRRPSRCAGDADAAAGGAVPRRAARRRRGGAAGALGHRARLRAMLDDAQARLLFVDAGAAALVPGRCALALHRARCRRTGPRRSTPGWRRRARSPAGRRSRPTRRSTSSIRPARPARPRASCSRTACAGRTCVRGAAYGYGPDSVTLLATPLYSNTTLVMFFPTIALGGTVVLMAKFDAARYLALAQQHRATHAMLVPVQYQRIMARPDFDALRPLVVPLQVLHQRAVLGRAEGRRAARAGRAGWSSSTA